MTADARTLSNLARAQLDQTVELISAIDELRKVVAVSQVEILPPAFFPKQEVTDLSQIENAIKTGNQDVLAALHTLSSLIERWARNSSGRSGNYAIGGGGNQVVIAGAKTAVTTRMNASATSILLLAGKSDRKGITIYNDSSAAMYVAYGVAATTTTFALKLPGNSLTPIDLPIFLGDVYAIWDSATGTANITELSG